MKDKDRKDFKPRKLNLNEKDIIWPEHEIHKPKGIKISTQLRVGASIVHHFFVINILLSIISKCNCFIEIISVS